MMRHRTLWPILLYLCTVSAVACGDGSFEERDYPTFRFPASSAKVVHEVTLSDLESAPTWTVDTVAPLTSDGAETVKVFQDLTDVLRLADGRLAAADGFGARILIFDEKGGLLEEWGGKGAGPGEFQHASWLGRCGTSGLYVVDLPLSRLTVYQPTGEVAEVVRLQPPDGAGLRRAPACSEAGDIALLGPLVQPRDRPVGPFRPLVTLSMRADGDDEFHEVTEVRGSDSYRWEDQMGPLGDFARRPVFDLADGSLFVATGDAFEIAEYDASGELQSLIVVSDIERFPITNRDLERVRREQLASTPERFRDRLEETLTSMEWPEYHPVLTALVSDSEGCLWVRHHRPDRSLATWRVLTRSGDPVGVVQLADDFTLTQVTDRELVGYAEDELDVGRIVVYRYERGADKRCR